MPYGCWQQATVERVGGMGTYRVLGKGMQWDAVGQFTIRHSLAKQHISYWITSLVIFFLIINKRHSIVHHWVQCMRTDQTCRTISVYLIYVRGTRRYVSNVENVILNTCYGLSYIMQSFSGKYHWWQVNTGSGDGLVPSVKKPLSESMLTHIYHHRVAEVQWVSNCVGTSSTCCPVTWSAGSLVFPPL